MPIFHYQDNIVYRNKMVFVIETYQGIGFFIITQPYYSHFQFQIKKGTDEQWSDNGGSIYWYCFNRSLDNYFLILDLVVQ